MEAFESPAPARPDCPVVRPLLAWTLNPASGELALSQALAELLGGEPPEDLAGFFGLLAGGREGEMAQSLQRILAGIAAGPAELQLALAGRTYLCRLQAMLHRGRPDRIQAVLDPTRDEVARQKLFSQLAHDVRNALSSVGGFSQLLRRRKLVSGEALSGVDRIQRAAEEAHQLLQEMLFARELELGGPGAPLEARLAATLRWFTIQAREKGLDFVSRVPADLPAPEMPAAWFERLLKQLLDNALRSTPSGGRIELEFACEDQLLSLSIRDTGVGVPVELLPYLFDKAALRDARSGGMALYLTQLIVQQFGGRIWCQSPCPESGCGSSFAVLLPLAP